jgi:hypothetical protein
MTKFMRIPYLPPWSLYLRGSGCGSAACSHSSCCKSVKAPCVGGGGIENVEGNSDEDDDDDDDDNETDKDEDVGRTASAVKPLVPCHATLLSATTAFSCMKGTTLSLCSSVRQVDIQTHV